MRAVFQRRKAAVHKLVRAETLPDPRFTFGYYTTPLETGGRPLRYKYGQSQTLPFFGKLGAKKQIALREADGIKAQFDALKLQTFYPVKTAYYEYAYLARAVDTTRKTIELMKYLEPIVTTHYTMGKVRHADIKHPQVEPGKLEDRLNSLTDLKRPLAANINSLLDRPGDKAIPFPANVPVMYITDTDASLFARLNESNPQLDYKEGDDVITSPMHGKRPGTRDFAFPALSYRVCAKASPTTRWAVP